MICFLLLRACACLAVLGPRQPSALERWPVLHGGSARKPAQVGRLGWCEQVQVVALECLPCIPAHMLCKALAGEELAKRIAQCLSNSSKEVRMTPTHCRPCAPPSTAF